MNPAFRVTRDQREALIRLYGKLRLGGGRVCVEHADEHREGGERPAETQHGASRTRAPLRTCNLHLRGALRRSCPCGTKSEL